MCFMGGAVTIVLGMAGLLNVFAAIIEPLTYVINAYQLVFGIVTCIIEAPQHWTHNNPRGKLRRAQGFIYEFAKFLTLFGGRALFYLFQGSIAVTLPKAFLSLVLGFY